MINYKYLSSLLLSPGPNLPERAELFNQILEAEMGATAWRPQWTVDWICAAESRLKRLPDPEFDAHLRADIAKARAALQHEIADGWMKSPKRTPEDPKCFAVVEDDVP